MATRPYPELSFPGIALGVLQGVLMTAAFVYIALKLGFGLGGSTVAAIVGFTFLRGALRRKSIVENNINQTVASGINTASAGVVFTLPALLLLSVGDETLRDFPIGPLIFASIAGSLMGIVLIIPLRKQMIEFERLKFPSGTAVATLLRSPGEGLSQGVLLIVGAGLALVLTVLVNLAIVPEELDFGHLASLPAWLPIALYISAANFGAGLLSGKGGLPFALGGVLAWWIITPVAVSAGWIAPPDAMAVDSIAGWQAGEVYSQMLRPLGIGMLIGGALAGVVSALPAVKGAFASLKAAAKIAREKGASPEEMGSKVLGFGAVGAFGLLFTSAYFAADISVGHALLIAVVAALWLALAGIIVATATGHTDISPLSGLALIAVTLMYFLTDGNVTAAILIGVSVCIATNQCADMMSDLKTGHLVGATPRNQQIAQLLLCWLGPLVAIGVLFLLWNMPGDGSPGFGPESAACINETADCLLAPQAGALQGMIEALQGGDAAIDKYLGGAVIGGALSVFPIGGVAVLVGLAMYLPFSITLAYGVGCVVAMGLEKSKGKVFIGKKLVPFAAGLIVGEALTQLVWSVLRMVQGGGA
ncbi:MAG: peptide transporter [Proteobacteria bacterium]|nr:peptide transporter [Pseudomonadota bacterium]MCP4915818.1 peptide transporter [Pseudomonadota bacterium]